MKLFGATFALAVLACAASRVHADSQAHALYISDFTFILKPEARQEPPLSERLKDPAPRKVPLVLWTKLAGNADGIARLKQGGFKLVHKWSIDCGRGPDGLPDSTISEIPYEYSGEVPWPQVAEELEKEIPLRESREFDWRTISQRDYVVGCKYTVRVVDELDNELYCASLGAPCVLTIGIKR